MEPTVQNPKRDPERHLRIQLTDPYSSQPLESRDDWRAGKSREKSSRGVARKQSGGRLVTQGASSRGFFETYYLIVSPAQKLSTLAPPQSRSVISHSILYATKPTEDGADSDRPDLGCVRGGNRALGIDCFRLRLHLSVPTGKVCGRDNGLHIYFDSSPRYCTTPPRRCCAGFLHNIVAARSAQGLGKSAKG